MNFGTAYDTIPSFIGNLWRVLLLGNYLKNPSPRLLGKKFETQKSKNKPCKNETSRLIKNAFEILRSCQNSPRPTFFEVPFATPIVLTVRPNTYTSKKQENALQLDPADSNSVILNSSHFSYYRLFRTIFRFS